MSEYTFLYINHSWLKLTACFFFLAMFSQSSAGAVARSFTVMHCLFFTWPPLIITPNWTCIWLWCVSKDCPCLSNSTLTDILILLHSMTEHVLGPFDGDAQQVPCHSCWPVWHKSRYLILSIMEINVCVRAGVFVCVNGQSFAQNTWRNRDYLEELDIAESIILKWIFKK